MSNRRIGAETSASRAKLVRAAEQLMIEEGYAAVTSRRVAAAAGLKPQLVHYYFRTMDDLYVEVFRWRAEQALAHQEEILQSATPITDLWRLSNDRNWIALSIELSALANHRPEIASEIARYGEAFRERQMAVMTEALDRAGIDRDDLPPEVALVLMTSLSRVLAMEAGLGMTLGHDATHEVVEKLLARLEGPAADQGSPGAPVS